MAKPKVLEEEIIEGTGAELAEQLRQPERAERLFRVVPLSQETSVEPSGLQEPVATNELALSIMRQIAERHKGRRTTDNSDTQRLLREARGGAAYGYEPRE
jgi:hypothetical protein